MMAALAIACSAFYIPARSPLMASRAIGPASAHVTLAAPPEVQVAFGMVMLLSVTHGLLPQPGGNKDARGSQQQAAARQTRTARVGAKPRRSTPRLCDSDEGKRPKATLKMKLSKIAQAAVGAVKKKRKNKPGNPTNMLLAAAAGAGAKVTKPNAEPPPKALGAKATKPNAEPPPKALGAKATKPNAEPPPKALGAKATKPNAEPPPKALHTLLLLQTTAATTTRTWSNFTSLPLALDAFIALYEKELRKRELQSLSDRELDPGLAKRTYSYSVAALHKYVDSLFDVSLMVNDPATNTYAPRGKPFLKDKLLEKLHGSGKGGGGDGGGGIGRGQGNGGGWPSTKGNPSGGGRSNNPPSK
jgi:hypothetical protein